MATIKTAIALYDGVTGPLKSIVRVMDTCLSSFEALQTASSNPIDTGVLIRARGELTKVCGQFEEIENAMAQSAQSQRRVTDELNRSSVAAGGLQSTLRGTASLLGGLAAVRGAIDLSDQMTSVTARLTLMVDDGGSVAELENKIMGLAQRSRAAYLESAAAVSKLGLNAGNAFKGNDEIIAFVEQVNKQFVIAGASIQEQKNAMVQLTQAMAAGALRGEELNSILDSAPGIARAIERYLGIAEGSIKSAAEKGQVTARVVKNSLFAIADETNAKFETMPMTWGQVWIGFSNIALFALRPVLAGINWLANNIKIIGPVVLGLGTAFLVFQVAAHWTQIAAATMAIYHAVVGFLSIGFGVLTGSTAAASAAVFTFNSALLASPILWTVAIMAVLIGALYGGVAAYNANANAAVSATGIIAGVFYTLGAHIFNTFIAPAHNQFASLANFFANLWNDPVAAAEVLFYDMALTIFGYLRTMARGIESLLNKIPGVTIDITSGLDNFYSGLEAAQRKVKDQSGWIEVAGKMDYWAYDDAAKAGYAMGQGIEEKVSGMFHFDDGGRYWEDIGGNTGDTAGNTAAMRDSLEITEEDLSYWRDIAEREAINRYTTAEITVHQHNENHIEKDTDIDGVMDAWANDFAEKLDNSPEGVHE